MPFIDRSQIYATVEMLYRPVSIARSNVIINACQSVPLIKKEKKRGRLLGSE